MSIDGPARPGAGGPGGSAGSGGSHSSGGPAGPAGWPGGAGRPRRSRGRIVVPLVFAGWVVLEVWLLSVVADAAGVLTVVALLLAGVVLGGAVVRRAGLRAWRNFSAAVQSRTGTPPESSGAALLMFAGLLFVLPGFASDALGLLVLLPPVRALLRTAAERLVARSGFAVAGPSGPVGPLGDAYRQVRIHRPDGKIVQGEVVDREEAGGTADGGRDPGQHSANGER